MWSNVITDIAFGDDYRIPGNAKFLEKIKDVIKKSWDVWKRNEIAGHEAYFYDYVMLQQDVLLYVQRKFIATSGFFPDTLFELDDTNMPFDYDHISPSAFITGRGKNKPPKPINTIYNAPCNKRVWPFSLNRADSDDVPAEKFTTNKKPEEKKSKLQKLLKEKSIKCDDIDSFLLESSFCEKSWCKFSEEWLEDKKITRKSKWTDIYNLLWKRWKNIYNELNRELRFGCLSSTPKNKINGWADVIKGGLWENPKTDDEKDWYRLLINKNSYFYLYQPSEDDEYEFQFGIYGETEYFSKYKGKDKSEEPSPIEDDKHQEKCWIYDAIRLSCTYIEGYQELYHSITKWLKKIKYNDIGEKAIERLEKNTVFVSKK